MHGINNNHVQHTLNALYPFLTNSTSTTVSEPKCITFPRTIFIHQSLKRHPLVDYFAFPARTMSSKHPSIYPSQPATELEAKTV